MIKTVQSNQLKSILTVNPSYVDKITGLHLKGKLSVRNITEEYGQQIIFQSM